MFKIKDRIAILYSLITILLVILCSGLFLFLFKYNMDRESIIQDIASDTIQDITPSTKRVGEKNDADYKEKTEDEKNTDYETVKIVPYKDRNIKIKTDERYDSVVVYEKDVNDNGKSESDGKSNSNDEGNSDDNNDEKALSFTVSNFEERIIENLYSRFLVVIPIAITIIIIINFILSKRYALFALSPLNEFTRKVKEQRKLTSIGLIEVPKVNDEIFDLTVAYNEVISNMKLSYENLQRLNSYASHELRNSLAVLRTKIELEEDSKDINKYIDKLNGTITDILAMSTNSLSKYQEDVDLALVCAKVVDEYSIIFKNIKFNMPLEGIDLIKGREIWIERCIVNIVDNAIKFIDKDKENNEISINISQNFEEITIEIYDNGIGIAKDKLDDIFIPYYGTSSRVSTGIGLAYVKHIMNLHKGKVSVESVEGEYTKFLLVFRKDSNEAFKV